MPFYGDDRDALDALQAIARLQIVEGDELLVADNTPDGVMSRHEAPAVTVVPAGEMQSSYYARNAGAEHATNEWLLFIDADTDPHPLLLDQYFAEPIADDVGAVAGEVVGAMDQTALAARYSRSRRHIGQAELLNHPYRPMAVTASLLVRTRAWRELGGFLEGMRSSGDADFSWRLQDAGWKLEYTQAAVVEHHHRESMRALLRVAARYGAGRRWLLRRHPRARFASPLRGLARCIAGIVVWTLTARLERALFKGIDALWILAEAAGSLSSNVSRNADATQSAIVFIASRFPVEGDPVGSAARATGGPRVLIEALARPEQPDRAAGRGLQARYAEDDGPLRRQIDLAWLAIRHPVRCASDRRENGAPLRVLAPVARRVAGRRISSLNVLAASGAERNARRVAALIGISCVVEDAPVTRPSRASDQSP